MRALILGLAISAVAAPALADGFTVTTPDFTNGGTMPMALVSSGCKGENHSPALSWSGEPAGTLSFAVTMYDRDAPTGSGWWHWTVFNIPATVHSLAADAGAAGSKLLPMGAGEGRTDSGPSNYSGPCPPAGDAPHHYEITVYAVKMAKLPLDETASGARVGFNLHFNALAKAQVVGVFGRPK
jgi:Raf kinase inhibitor-like YbhB/YbcL family protein